MPYKDPEKQRKVKYESYLRNKEKYNKVRKEKREYLWKLKSVPCMDCGGTFPPYVMEFDHILERGNKIMGLAKAVGSMGWKRMLEEIEKCEIICANCHAIRTWKRNNESL